MLATSHKWSALVTIFLFVISTAALSQEVPITKPWFIGISIAPGLYNQTSINNDGTQTSEAVTNSCNNYYEAKISFAANLNVSYALTNHFRLEGGVGYSNKGYLLKFDYDNLFFGDQIDPRNGIVYYTEPEFSSKAKKATYNFEYLDIPLRAIVFLGNKKIRFISSLGITTNIFLAATQTVLTVNDNGSKARKTDKINVNIKPLNISPSATIGLNYRISDQINISLEPGFRYGLLKISETPVTRKLWNTEVNLSAYYKIR